MGQIKHSNTEYKVHGGRNHIISQKKEKEKPARPVERVWAKAWEQMKSFREGLCPKREEGQENQLLEGGQRRVGVWGDPDILIFWTYLYSGNSEAAWWMDEFVFYPP